MIDIKLFFGITAGILSVLAFVPYILSILKGKTKPARATWFIWSIVTILLFLSFDEVGGGTAKWLFLGYIIGAVVTALFSIKYGIGGWTKLDKFVLLGCTASVAVWLSTGSAFIGLIMVATTDVLAALPTIVHAWTRPEEEDKLAWIMGLSANSLNLVAITKWDIEHALAPFYLFLILLAITAGLFISPAIRIKSDIRVNK